MFCVPFACYQFWKYEDAELNRVPRDGTAVNQSEKLSAAKYTGDNTSLETDRFRREVEKLYWLELHTPLAEATWMPHQLSPTLEKSTPHRPVTTLTAGESLVLSIRGALHQFLLILSWNRLRVGN